MKFYFLISFLLLGDILILAQTDSLSNKKPGNIEDSNKVKTAPLPSFINKNMVIQKKDLKLITPVQGMNFIVDGDTLSFSEEEIESGLTIDELKAARANRDSLLSYIKPRVTDEEKKYPFLYQLRKYLGAAKTVGVIIILLLSFLK